MTHSRAPFTSDPAPSDPHPPTPAHLRRIAVSAALQAGEALAEAFRSQMEVATKTSAHDLVTVYDEQTEQRLIKTLTAAVPDSRITGEEGGSVGHGRLEWIIDPIDGTSNFAHGFAMFSISIAAALDDVVLAGVVHDPVNRLTFSADDAGAYLATGDSAEQPLRPTPKDLPEEHLNLVTSFPGSAMVQRRGQEALTAFGELVTTYSAVRRLISGALELCHAAAGWADVACGGNTRPWDVAAGQLILRRAGGQYLPYGARQGRSWDGAPTEDAHLAPGYIGLGPGVQAPTAQRVIATFAHRG
ncbi:inositol monophosphatase family protein [Nesterenkonia alba]|uniref:inositol monophosphatase family protein n=1 Tax=Nesterenkonia alba TaxID=515814 RepID=UPI0003B54788|nr:inositol monophosphatase family protein [Nesterenkonia alba]